MSIPDQQAVTTADSDQFLSSFYRDAFARFDANEGQPDVVWNWAAFLITPIWYLAKGMWLKTAVWLFAILVVAAFEVADASMEGLSMFAALGLAVYAGANGTYDLYLLHRYGRQGFERPRRASETGRFSQAGTQAEGATGSKRVLAAPPPPARPMNKRASRTGFAAIVAVIFQFSVSGYVDGWNTRRLVAGGVFTFVALIIGYHAWKSLREVAASNGKETGNGGALIAIIGVLILIALSSEWVYATYLNFNR